METFKITATIPTVQYGNIQPAIEVEAETYEEAKAIGLARIEELWGEYGDKQLKKASNSVDGFVELDTFTGEKILYNTNTHVYKDLQGNRLISGSEYKKSFDKPFDNALLSGMVGKKNNIPAEIIASVWAANSKISTTFGTALHLAMEQWYKNRDNACGEKQYNLAKPIFLREMITSFPRKDDNIITEVLVSHVASRMAGQIDGIVITGDKSCRVIDYKSDADISKNLEGHFRQLSFYAKILTLAGWSVEGLEVWNYTNAWERFEGEVQEVRMEDYKF